jgi:hypothetical protein
MATYLRAPPVCPHPPQGGHRIEGRTRDTCQLPMGAYRRTLSLQSVTSSFATLLKAAFDAQWTIDCVEQTFSGKGIRVLR